MAEAVVNVIPLSSTTTKLYFRDWDSPDVDDLTSVTFDSTAYDVLETGGGNRRWVIVDTGYSTFGDSRVVVIIDGGGSTPACYNGGTAGLYTKEEIDDLVADGYIPIANADEFGEIDDISGLPQTMGLGSCWEGDYTTGVNEKYIIVSDIDFTGYTEGSANVTNIIDGNELTFSNLDVAFPLFDCSGATIKNIRIVGGNMDSTGGSVGSRGILVGTITSGTLDNNIVDATVFNDGVTGIMCGGNTTTLSGAVTINNCHTSGSCESVGSGTNNSGVGGVAAQLIGSVSVPVSIVNCSNDGTIISG
jgi:hypothetical protein